MRRFLLPLAVVAVAASPTLGQETWAPAEPVREAPIPVQQESAAGSITPGSMAAGSAAGTVIVLLGLGVIAIAMSSLGS